MDGFNGYFFRESQKINNEYEEKMIKKYKNTKTNLNYDDWKKTKIFDEAIRKLKILKLLYFK